MRMDSDRGAMEEEKVKQSKKTHKDMYANQGATV